MKLRHGLHLAYCTNIHRGESWEEVFASLKRDTLQVRRRVAPGRPYAIGLRLGADAARQLSDPPATAAFRRWLDREGCYVVSLNGFPYGRFHGTRVKERVYRPDWTTPERLDYTCLLFDLLAEILPEGEEGSVSTVPVGWRRDLEDGRRVQAAQRNLWKCVDHIERARRRSGRILHLGLEPEPCCWLETSDQTARFFERMRRERPGDLRLEDHLGVNYDCCHLAVQYENAGEALGRLRQHRIRISKIHLSSALGAKAGPEARDRLAGWADDVWLHQVVERRRDGRIVRHDDLPQALGEGGAPGSEWRVHFHIPLHAEPSREFSSTSDHIAGALDFLRDHPGLCSHLEMETYTWEALPAELKQRSVADQLVAEYRWTLDRLAERGFCDPPGSASSPP